MRVLVLGATGFIGGSIARAACDAGMEVVAARRKVGSTGALEDAPVRWVEADLDDAPSLLRAVDGCDAIFHAAGYVPYASYDVRAAVAQGVMQMRNLVAAAEQTGVQRIIYTSSLTTVGSPPQSSERLADERDAYLPGSTANPYYETKWAMEHEALRVSQAGLPVVTLCPTAVFGPHDVKPSTSELLLRLAKRQMPAGIDVETNIVDGRDVALAHIRALDAGKPGERYIIGGHNLNVAQALVSAAELIGVPAPRVVLSLKTAGRLIRLGEALRLPIPGTMRGLPYWQPYNCQKGWDTFALTPRPYEETVIDTVAWFRDNGYL